MNRSLIYCWLAITIGLSTGCKTILPREDERTKNAWSSFDEAQEAFEHIVPHATTMQDLHEMGFSHTCTPNLEILTYLDIIDRFIPNASISIEDLDPVVRKCIESKDCCQAYELNVLVQKKQRFGNALLDIFGFTKNTHTTGWNFKALVLIQDGLVIYKLRSGQPNIDRVQKKTQPLGPFQEMEGVVTKAVKAL